MELSTLILTILTAGICLYYFILRKLSHFERLKIPHVRPIPLLGNFAPFIFRRKSMSNILRDMYNQFSDAKYFGFYEFMRPVYVVRDPELIRTIAIKNFDHFCDHRNFVNEDIEPMASRNLFGLRGDHWREMRKLLSPSFTSSKMKTMYGLMCQCAENFADFLSTESGKTGKTYEMKDVLSRYATDVVATCAYGISVNSFKHPKNEFFLLGKRTMAFHAWRTIVLLMHRNFPKLAKLLKLRIFSAETDNFFKDIVINTVKARDEQGIVRPDMIQLMMETRNKDQGPSFDISEMAAQAFVFFLAGYETSSTAMCCASHEIAVNPDIQSKLREEVDDVLRETNGKPTYEAINGMKYLDATVNEALRLYPPAIFLERLCVKKFELPPAISSGDPIIIKPGESIWIPTYSLHHDSKYYLQPEKFDPDRFLNGQVDNSVYMTFGIGPRICIGNRFALMEMKIMLFYLLWRCDLKPDVKTKNPMVLDKRVFPPIAEGGFWLKLRTRNSAAPVAQNLSNEHGTENIN